jgi:hypothetical protein
MGMPVGTFPLPCARLPVIWFPSGMELTPSPDGQVCPAKARARQRLTTAIPEELLFTTLFSVTVVVSAPSNKTPMPGGNADAMLPGWPVVVVDVVQSNQRRLPRFLDQAEPNIH